MFVVQLTRLFLHFFAVRHNDPGLCAFGVLQERSLTPCDKVNVGAKLQIVSQPIHINYQNQTITSYQPHISYSVSDKSFFQRQKYKLFFDFPPLC